MKRNLYKESRTFLRCVSQISAVSILMLMIMSCLVSTLPAHAGEVETISAAGATFPYPIYSKWADRYEKLKDLKIFYQAIGSGGGIAQIKAKTVDFGASDRPLKSDELDKEGLIQFPLIVGGIVPVVNIKGVYRGQLKITPELLVGIYLGEVKKWNHRRVKAINPGLRLPDTDVTVIHRADGSGSTWLFTTYLSKVSEDWKEKVGSGKAVSWPTGVGAKGNPGVAARVKKIDGAIGYVEFAYALKNRLNYAKLQNRHGDFVRPTISAFQAAAKNADWENAPGFYMDLTDQPGKQSWPITGASYILIHKDQADQDKAKAMLDFFKWCYEKGQGMAKRQHYVPIPKNVYTMVEDLWKKEVTFNGNLVLQ